MKRTQHRIDSSRRRVLEAALVAAGLAALQPFSRGRGIAQAAAAAGPAAGAGASGAAAGRAMAAPRRLIDVHHHVFTPSMQEALRGKLAPAVLVDVDRSLASMDATGTTTTLISYPNPDILALPPDKLDALIRKTNEECLDASARHPGRYGLLASIPMPHVDLALKGIAHALDELHADGLLLLSSYGNKWLGDAAFQPVLQELNRRKAVVFVHPAAADCCRGLIPGLNDSVIEYETDTARTIASLLFTGSAERFPDIQFIFSHAGGTVPSLIARFQNAPKSSPAVASTIPQGALAYLRRFNYDVAQASNDSALGALMKFVPAENIVFGTDFPYMDAAAHVQLLQAMNIAPQVLEGIYVRNALRLFPALARRLG